jgi:two-component system, NarL family, sensor kinase
MQASTIHMIIQVIFITSIFLVAATFLVSYVFLYNKRKKRHIEEKEKQRVAFEEELLKTQLEVQEQTLKTIADEIHDNIGQILSLTHLTLSAINIPEKPLQAEDKVASALNLVTSSIKELRQLASVLHAENILATGLEKAIKSELNWIARSGKYKVGYKVINNIIKHACASEISIEFAYIHNHASITIRDNGIGFDVENKIKNPTGLGLNNFYKRASLISGHFEIRSEIGYGTTAILKIPYSSF